MSPERWQQIEKIFQEALDLKPAERLNYLKKTCKDDLELKNEVEKLLSQFEASSDFIEKPLYQESNAGVLASLVQDEGQDSMIGNTLGSYKIEREIGRGGMGAVYEAVRADGSFRMRAAIKLVKRGMDTDFILKRFRNERQILATLEHPFITRLIDGGTTPDGRPYFVMDYIDGQPLYNYCDNKRLSIKERLQIFRRICDAVDYAHQQMVIHRDLKPSNILVAKDGTPRLLDFGIAKLLDPEMSADTLQPTATAMRMMTVDYASPEQVRGEQVTYSTDIYSLGVILYELLTGHRPYNFKSRLIEHAAKVIIEQVPAKPSAVVSSQENFMPPKGSSPDEAPTLRIVGRNRSAAMDELRQQLEGNLDRIILKALRKDPANRYESMREFRDDILNHLEGRPVMADDHPESVQTGEHERYIPKDDNSIAVLPFKVLGALSGEETGDEYLGIGLADTLITRLSQMKRFTVRPTSSVLRYREEQTDPFAAGESLGVRYVLDGTIRQVKESLRVSVQMLDMTTSATIWAEQFNNPANDILELEDVISEKVVSSLVPQITGEEKQRISKRGTDNAEAYEAYMRGRYFWNQFNPDTFPKALESYERAVKLDPKYALAYAGIADYYNWATIFGFYAPREGYQKTRAAALRALEIDDQLSEAISILGFIAAFSDFNWAEAERLFKKSLELNPKYGLTHEWYSALLAGVGRNEEAYVEIIHSQGLDPLSLRTVTLTAWTLYQLRRYPEALRKIDEIFEMSPGYYQGYFQRGNILNEMGRAEEAVAAGRKGMEIAPGLGYMNYKLCFALASLNRFDEAREVLRKFEAMSPAPEINSYHFGMCYAALGEHDLAFKWLSKAVEDSHPWCVWLATEPKLDRLRGDERFNDLLRKTNRQHLIKKISAEAAQTLAEKVDQKDAVKSLAVLPFQYHASSTGGDTDGEFLGLGVTDALVARLSGIKSLSVRPTTSVIKYNIGNIDSLSAGQELGVDFVLEGNIRQVGGRIRFSAQLLDVAKRGTHWAKTFDDTFTDILALEDMVSERVARSLIPELTGEEEKKLAKRGTNNPEAYQAYLRGRTHWLNSSPEELARALVAYNEAIALDPDFAAPYTGIADYHNFLSVFGLMAPNDSFPAARENAEKALSLDPDLAEAYVSLGMTAYAYEWDFDKSERLFKKALELSPNYAVAHTWYAHFLSLMGRHEEALFQISRADELAPDTYATLVLYAFMLRNARRFEEARVKLKRANELQPNHYLAMQAHSWNVVGLKNYDDAERECRKAVEVTERMNMAVYALAFTLAAAGKKEESASLTAELISRRERQYVPPCYMALIYSAAGNIDDAFNWLEIAYEERDCWLPWLAIDPRFDTLRKDHRYLDLLRRIGHPFAHKQKSDVNLLPVAKDKAEKVSLAVLPLSMLGGSGEEDAHLPVGLADVMITRLSQVKRLIVKPTSAVLRYAGSADPFNAGRELGVDYALCGTIRPAGKRVRISAQLIDIKANSTLWSDKFDEDFGEVLALEDVVAEKVAKLLIPKLTTEEEQRLTKRKTNSPEAYEAYIKGKHHLYLFSPENFEKALFYLNKAIEIDPNYALPYAALSDCYFSLTGFSSRPPSECFPMMEKMAKKAVELDDSFGDAYSNLAMIAFYSLDAAEGERLFKKGIELNPNQQSGYIFYSVLLNMLGRYAEAIDVARRAMEFDQTSIFHRMHYTWVLYHARHFDEAVKEINSSEWVNSDFPHALGVASWIHRHLGNYEQAIEFGERSVKFSPQTSWFLSNLGVCYAKSGNREKALGILKELEKRGKNEHLSLYCLAQLHLYLGDKEKAIGLLERSVEEKDVWFPWLTSDPEFDTLRNEPRFQRLVNKLQGADSSEPTTATFQAGVTGEIQGPDTAEEPVGKETVSKTAPGFFYRHRYKWAAAGVLSVLTFIAYLTGFLTVSFKQDGVTVETDKADSLKQKKALPSVAPILTPNSIVILPFTVVDAVNNDLGVGLADSLTAKLGAVKRLTVISANSGRAVANKDLPEISRELGVQYILTSNIQKNDGGLRVISELFDAQNDKQMWREEIDTKPDELFTVVNKMGEKILEAVKIEALPIEKEQVEKTYTKNGLAYELYLIGRSQMAIRSPETIRKAIAAFNRAKEQDPGFVLAYVGLADAYNMQSLYEIPAPPDSYPNAIENAKKALAIDPELAEAHVSLGYATFFYLRDRAAAELEYRRAIQINPSYAQAHSWFSSFLIATNRLPEAISEAETAKRLDPMALTSGTGMAYFYSRDFERSIQQAEASLALNPNFVPAIKLLRWNYTALGKYGDAKTAYLKERSSDTEGTDADWYMIEAQVEALKGNKAQILEKLNASVEVKSVKDNPNAYAYEIALAYNALGEKEKTFEWLEKAESAKSYGFNFLEVDHRLEGLRSDQRFQKLLQKLTGPKQ